MTIKWLKLAAEQGVDLASSLLFDVQSSKFLTEKKRQKFLNETMDNLLAKLLKKDDEES